MHAFIISEIWIYPIKSLGGIRLSSVQVLPKGLANDRRWMLVDEQDRFMTQRDHPAMALFKVEPAGEGFIVNYKNDTVPLPSTWLPASFPATVWDDTVHVHEVDTALSEWFSQRLHLPCRLVAFPESYRRPVDTRYARKDEQVGLADAYPVLVIGQPSLDDLNRRLEVPVPMNRFRPNIVFTGGAPYAEDGWGLFRAGTLSMEAVKPCARCVLTTINQDTAEKGKEPLATLSAYRRKNNKVCFGQNVLVHESGTIHEGDTITPG